MEKITKNDVGREVIVEGGNEKIDFDNVEGIILDVEPSECYDDTCIAVKFKHKRSYHFHSCGGICTYGKGYFLSPENIKCFIKEQIKMGEFDQDFRVGDEVIDIRYIYGGVVKEISEIGDLPVYVWFNEKEMGGYYSKQGKRNSVIDDNPVLFHKGTKVEYSPHRPERYPWVNVYYDKINNEPDFGNTFLTKEEALGLVLNDDGYVDTIQLKPKKD